jgi:Mor family transcriptional regulator
MINEIRVEELKRPGATVAIIARKYKLTQRQIYTIMNRAKSKTASENGQYNRIFYDPK